MTKIDPSFFRDFFLVSVNEDDVMRYDSMSLPGKGPSCTGSFIAHFQYGMSLHRLLES